MKKYLLFGLIASILSVNAYAVSATVTSKDYVDTTRQATIPASGTNSETPGDTVVTYTSTAGTIGERGICNDSDEDDCNGGDLVTVDQLGDFADYVENQIQNLPEAKSTYKTCEGWIENAAQTDDNCLLWRLRDQTVYSKCHNHSDCKWLTPECSSGATGMCNPDTGVCGCGFR